MHLYPFTRRLKQVLSALLSCSIVLTSTLPARASAQAVPACNAWAADSGASPHCAAVRVGGVPVAYPKLQWVRVADMPTVATPGSAARQGGSQAVELGNRAAVALGLNAADIANVSTLFPSNVPYAFARYNPVDATLRIDLFKLEKAQLGSETRAGLYSAVFTPAHGDHWKAQRAYIHPDSFKTGMAPGVNPFRAFESAGSELFHNISMPAAQVAVGHAMRLAGAPLALMSVADTRTTTRTKKSGGLFKKKVETWVYGHTKSQWFIAQPSEVLSRSTTPAFASICAQDPTRTSCAVYETAVSGVGFEEFEGGTLSALEDVVQLDYQKQSGLSFLGALVLGVLGSFALVSIMGAAGVGGLAGGAGATAGAGAGSTLGTFSSFLVNQGLITGYSTVAGALAMETMFVGLSMAIAGGANLSSVINTSPAVLLGVVDVSKGIYIPGPLNKYAQKLNQSIGPKFSGEMNSASKANGAVLQGFAETVLGTCGPNAPLTACAGATGMIPRVDQYREQNLVEFTRDNSGSLLRHEDSRNR